MVSGERSLIRLASPDIRDDDVDRMVAVVRSGELVQGKAVAEFEQGIVEFSGIPYCAAVSSGTAALHLALVALGVGPGDRVLVPAFTFPATANVVERIGASVVFCDVGPGSYVVTPDAVEVVLASPEGPSIRAVILVHEFGFPVLVQQIAEITCRYGALLIEDAACALGTVADRQHPGYYSDIACLSFHPRKAITTGEGGALLSRNPALIADAKRLRNHGITQHAHQLDFTEAGLNYRLTNFQAALGIGQLSRFREELLKRRSLADIYLTRLAGAKGIDLPENHLGHSWQSFMVVLDGVPRESVRAELLERGIESNLGAQALNCLSYYREKYDIGDSQFPVATKLFRQGLVLPLYGKLSPADIEMISTSILEVVGSAS